MEAPIRPLPKGWMVRQSKSRTGHWYYFNTSTGQSSWKHPSAINLADLKTSKKKLHRCGDSSSISSGDTKIPNVLLSPVSPSASFASSAKLNKKAALVIPIQHTTKCNDDDKIDSPKHVSPQHPFQCSRSKANHISEWVDHVNSTYEPSEQGSVSAVTNASDIDSISVQERTIGTAWKQEVQTKKIKRKKKQKRNKPIPDESVSTETVKRTGKSSIPKLVKLKTSSSTVSQSIKPTIKQPSSSTVTQPSRPTVTQPSRPTVTQPSSSTVKQPSKPTVTQPSSSTITQPSISYVVQPSISNVAQPSTSSVTQPSTVTITQPSTVKATQPSASSVTQPIASSVTQPSTSLVTQPSTLSVTQPSTSNKRPSNKPDSKITRPPLKKVNKRNKTTNYTTLSPTSPAPSFTPNLFTLFTQIPGQQDRQPESQVTPMNIDRNTQRFSTPFMKSSPPSGPQDLFTSPISMYSNVTPNTSQTSKQFDSRLDDDDVVIDHSQRDSGFDEVIDMDVDNYEELTQLIKVELQDVRSGFNPDLQKVKQERFFADSNVFEDGGLHIILDTNVLLSHLKFISELKDVPIEGVGRPVLVVPWIVMQELDSLKSDTRRPRQNNEESGVGVDTLARQAIRFLHSCFESKHPRIRGQTIDEASIQLNSMLDETNDDRILHCCLVVKRKVCNGESVLFSNDQNLCNKAMINGVRAFNHQNLINGLKELVQVTQVNTVALKQDNFKEYYEQVKIQERVAQKRAKADDILCELKCIMREGFAVAVESEMRAAYDDLWDKIVYIKPPWTMMDLLQILNKHWIAVFGDVLGRKKESTVKELMKLLNPEKGVPGCIANVSTILQLTRQLFDAFALRSSYNGTMPKCLAAIDVLQQKCKECRNDHLPRLILADSSRTGPIAGALPYTEPFTPTSTNIDESTPSSSDDTASVSSLSVQGEINSSVSRHPHSEVLSTFEVIWSAVTQFSAQVFNALSYPNPIPASVTENLPKPTRDEAISFLGHLCRSLNGLVTALHNVLRVPVEGLSEHPQSLERLIFFIGSFTKQIIGQDSQVSIEALLYFCQDSNTRSALVQGVSQLDRALAMLQHCASCIV